MTDRIAQVSYEFECASTIWRVRAVTLREELNRGFRAELRLVADEAAVLEELWGAPATFTMTRGDNVRTFRGCVSQASLSSEPDGASVAVVRFVPTLARLGWSEDSRVFQGETTIGMVRALFGLAEGLEVDVDPGVVERERDYCVQYRESDLAFASRLLEDEGLVWFLDDSGASQVLRIVADNAALTDVPDLPEARMITDRFDEAQEESVQALSFVHRVPSARVIEREWDWFGEPSVVEATFPAEGQGCVHAMHELRRRGADHLPDSARREYERRASRDLLGSGRSNIVGLGCGRRLTIVGPGRDAVEVVITSVTHHGDCPEVERAAAGHRPNYTNSFECQPAETPWRPQRRTPRPQIHGLHTAVVVGPPGEDIHTDEHGRIRVRMHWDRATTADAEASCWLRVAQSWAGQGWGTTFIPRVGMEVLVAFLEGDPDRPICVGCVYNGAHRPPYTLPDERTKSTIRTQSTPGGEGHNELTFEDAAGAEQIYVRAQRDLNTDVQRNEARTIGADQTIHVGHDQCVTIDGDQHVTLKGNQTVTIDGGGETGTAGSAIAVKGEVAVTVTEPGRVVIDAAQSIELRVGPTRVVIDAASIQLFAGGGAISHMNEVITLLAEGGAMARLGSTVALRSAAGAQVMLDKLSAAMSSPAGARVTLDDAATIASSLAGEELELAGGATLRSATIGLEASAGAEVRLDADATMRGGEVRSVSANGSLALTSGGATLDGTTVDVTAAAMATVISALVKIN